MGVHGVHPRQRERPSGRAPAGALLLPHLFRQGTGLQSDLNLGFLSAVPPVQFLLQTGPGGLQAGPAAGGQNHHRFPLGGDGVIGAARRQMGRSPGREGPPPDAGGRPPSSRAAFMRPRWMSSPEWPPFPPPNGQKEGLLPPGSAQLQGAGIGLAPSARRTGHGHAQVKPVGVEKVGRVREPGRVHLGRTGETLLLRDGEEQPQRPREGPPAPAARAPQRCPDCCPPPGRSARRCGESRPPPPAPAHPAQGQSRCPAGRRRPCPCAPGESAGAGVPGPGWRGPGRSHCPPRPR